METKTFRWVNPGCVKKCLGETLGDAVMGQNRGGKGGASSPEVGQGVVVVFVGGLDPAV